MEEFLTHLTSQVAKTMPGIAAGISVFIGFWIYCIVEYGFFFGVALGWLPSGIAATVAAVLWPLIALAVGFLVWGIFFQ